MSKKKKLKVGPDPNSIVPFISTGLFILVGGIAGSYLLNINRRIDQGDDAAFLLLMASIILSGLLFIIAWAKHQ